MPTEQATTITVQCPTCRQILRDDGTCYRCKDRARAVTNALRWCGLTLLPGANPSEASKPLAVLGDLTISHSHRGYWVVKGKVPVDVAERLYADPAGRDLIRVTGHCGCPPPSEWLTWLLPDGRQVTKAKEEPEWDRMIADGHLRAEQKARFVFDNDPASIGASAFVDGYHIDGDLGLRVFVDVVRSASPAVAPPATPAEGRARC